MRLHIFFWFIGLLVGSNLLILVVYHVCQCPCVKLYSVSYEPPNALSAVLCEQKCS